jgi:serine/threonine protein kinase
MNSTATATSNSEGFPRIRLGRSPVTNVNALIATAMSTGCDRMWVEPMPLVDDQYMVSMERQGKVIGTASVSAPMGSAIVARMACVCQVALPAEQEATGMARVRFREQETDLVFTASPGDILRGALLLVPRSSTELVQLDSSGDLHAGDVIGHYRVVSKIAAGGMGVVYRVHHPALHRDFALKVLSDEARGDVRVTEQFLREARAAARLRHVNIVDVCDFGHLVDGRPYSVMELVTGISLADLLVRGPMEVTRAVHIASQLASALAFSHSQGVIHSDVTPTNLLLDNAGDMNVKLVDFGLARFRDEVLVEEASDYVFGTPCYISPERIRGLVADERADQYAAGIVLFEMLTGAPPFQDESLQGLCIKHLSAPVPEMVGFLGPIPRALEEVVRRMLQKNPIARYDSMQDVADALASIERDLARPTWRKWMGR